MRILRIFTLLVVASAAACSQQFGSSQGASGSADAVVGSTGPITSADLEPMGTIPVIVFGSAFGLDRGMIEQAIADGMQTSAAGNTRFVPSSQASADPQGYTLVMLLNAPSGADDPAPYCATNPSIPMSGPAQRYGGARDVELAGALCRNGQEVRQVRTGTSQVSSLDDPAFRKMVEQAGSKLTSSSSSAAAP